MIGMVRRIHIFTSVFAIAGLAFAACGDESNTTTTSTQGTGAGTGAAQGGSGAAAQGGDNTASSGGNNTGGNNAGGTSAGGNAAGGQGQGLVQALCGNQEYECGDTDDNDGDGLIDSDDPDCLGPCDDTEDSYHPELPGWSGDACSQDCFWDTGNGQEGCYWDHHCDPLSVSPDYHPEGQACENTDPPDNAGFSIPGGGPNCVDALAGTYPSHDDCIDYCEPLTPNGCDCFGCCELPAGSGQTVWIGSYDGNTPTCVTTADFTDPDRCQPCTQVPACVNDCDTCEICIGKPFLPPECFDPPPNGSGGNSGTGGGGGSGGSPQECPPGAQACGLPGQDPCPAGSFCITGCCQLLPQ
jgi:hypothetical protein